MSEKEILEELQKITRILTFAHSEKIIPELYKIATTDKRKMIWALLNKRLMSNEIATKVEISTRAVDQFLEKLDTLGLAKNPPYAPPFRLIDYVPPDWIELIQLDKEEPKYEERSNE